MTSNDNWGWRARIGLFIVGNEAVPEAEWWAMAPPGVSVHAARVTARAPWARWRDDRKGVEPEEDLLRGCRQFAAMRLQAVVRRAQLEQPAGRQGLGRGHRGGLSARARRRRDRHHQRARHPGGAAGLGGEAAVPGPAALVQRRDGGGRPALLRRSGLRAGRPPSLRSRAANGATCRRPSSSATASASSRRSNRSTRRSRRLVRPTPTAC